MAWSLSEDDHHDSMKYVGDDDEVDKAFMFFGVFGDQNHYDSHCHINAAYHQIRGQTSWVPKQFIPEKHGDSHRGDDVAYSENVKIGFEELRFIHDCLPDERQMTFSVSLLAIDSDLPILY
jgi:hypothetical protein